MKKSEAVKVAIRIRPPNKRERDLNSPSCVTKKDSVVTIALNNDSKEFCFDHVFDGESKQEDVYESTAFSLVESVAEGYNGTIFAYGQTGAGKTWTMVGLAQDEQLKGIIPRTCTHLFNITQSGEAQQYLLRASFIEIYNEQIRDLLVDKKKVKDNSKEIKQSPDKGVYIKDLIMAPAKNVEEMEKLLAFGNINRTVHATDMNAVSSRSHAVFTLYLDTLNEVAGKQTVKAGKLNLVDLAGSERQNKTNATGDRLKQGAKINLSLSALGNVINVLAQGKKGVHIPYRDSKLTRILQDSLGGNTKTIMIASISPAADNFDETLGTLRYASRAKNIKNAPKINEDPKDALIKEYADQIRRLKMELSGQSPLQLMPSDQKIKEIEQQMRKQIEGQRDALEREKLKILEQKDQEKEDLMKRLREMEENLLKKDESQATAQKVTQRKNKKRKILKQEQIISERNQEYVMENENLLNGDIPKFGSEKQENGYLRSLVDKLRVKCHTYIKQAADLQKQFEQERQFWTSSMRQIESQASFFKEVSKILLSEEQILKIKDSSIYDDQKREYTVPPFILKDELVHFPKSLTNEQMLDLINEKKSKRSLEVVKLEAVKGASSESPTSSPGFRTRKYVYKVPDLSGTAYADKNYQELADSLFEDDRPFNRTNMIFRTTRDRSSEVKRSVSSRHQKLEPLKVVSTKKPEGEEQPSTPDRRTGSRNKLTPVSK